MNGAGLCVAKQRVMIDFNSTFGPVVGFSFRCEYVFVWIRRRCMCDYDFIDEYDDLCGIESGGNCDIDVDECASSPCENAATCRDSSSIDVSIHAYQCVCTAGHANGVCLYDHIDEYVAECSVMESDDGWMSGNCDMDVNECASEPCQNGAVCMESSANSSTISLHSYSCLCTPGFMNGACAYDYLAENEASCNVYEMRQL